MIKLLLLSVVITAIAAPIIAGRNPNGQRGLRQVLTVFAIFNVCYAVAICFFFRSPY